MAELKIYKRNNYIYFQGICGENPLRSVLRHMIFDKLHKIWKTEATLSVFRDLYRKYKSNFLMTDPETSFWVQNSRIQILRLVELQTGLTKDSRQVNLPTSIDYVLPPFQHQKEAIATALNIPKLGLFLDMGLGKSYTSITIAKLRHASKELGAINKVLIICPRSLIYQWEQEINRLAPDAEVYNISGTPAQKVTILQQIPQDKFSFTLITYESVGAESAWLKAINYDMFILDESTKIKNPKAKRTLDTIEICNTIPYGLILSGMPYVSNPLDLFAQFMALDQTVYGNNQWLFSDRYIEYVSLPFGKVIKGFKKMDELKERAYLASFSRTKDQCLDLPEKIYQVRKLPIYESQYEWYVELLKQIEKICTLQDTIEESTKTNSPVTVEYVVAMLEKFQQITSGYITTDDGEFIWLDSPKYEEMLSVIRGSKDSFIIWARHTYVLQKIKDYLAQHEIEASILDRRCSDAQRKTLKEQFKKGTLRIIIAQIASECRGNDLTCETHSVSSIFFENTPSVEERSQAEDRQHRIGMTGTAVYVDLICEDTYDDGIKFLLESKRKLAEYIRRKDLDIILGTGGSIGIKKTKSKKRPKPPFKVKTIISSTDEDSTESFLQSLDLV